MYVLVAGGRNPGLTAALLGRLHNLIGARGTAFVSVPEEYPPKYNDLNILDSMIQILVDSCSQMDRNVFILPTALLGAPVSRKVFQHNHFRIPPAPVKTFSNTSYVSMRSYKRAPRGGIALIRQYERSSNPSRKSRRNGSR